MELEITTGNIVKIAGKGFLRCIPFHSVSIRVTPAVPVGTQIERLGDVGIVAAATIILCYCEFHRRTGIELIDPYSISSSAVLLEFVACLLTICCGDS